MKLENIELEKFPLVLRNSGVPHSRRILRKTLRSLMATMAPERHLYLSRSIGVSMERVCREHRRVDKQRGGKKDICRPGSDRRA